MGILVGDFAIQYEAFDNMLAAGIKIPIFPYRKTYRAM